MRKRKKTKTRKIMAKEASTRIIGIKRLQKITRQRKIRKMTNTQRKRTRNIPRESERLAKRAITRDTWIRKWS